ncbi:hypothetical protein BC835DRAFT_313181 [Cytidiella melzeri]|nr:hypothetical protein BC835DRAFT_313181 [Cytidiella melzeri]
MDLPQLSTQPASMKLTASANPVTPPPSYSPSLTSVPSYAIQPSEDELSLETSGRSQSPIPCGEFTVKTGNLTVTLHEQEFGAGIPTYRQNAIIKGSVAVGEHAAIALLIKLEGRQKLSIADIGTHERLMFSDTHDL